MFRHDALTRRAPEAWPDGLCRFRPGPENATGNWVKVTQRVPVWVSIIKQKQYPLRLGTSATVTINTTGLKST